MLREQLPDHEIITRQKIFRANFPRFARKITRPLRGLHTAADGRPTSKNLPPALLLVYICHHTANPCRYTSSTVTWQMILYIYIALATIHVKQRGEEEYESFMLGFVHKSKGALLC